MARQAKQSTPGPLTLRGCWEHLAAAARLHRRGADPAEALHWASIEIEIAGRLAALTAEEAAASDGIAPQI